MLKKSTKTLWFVAIVLLLSACTSVKDIVQEPSIRLDGVKLDLANIFRPKLYFDLHIKNPNPFALPVQSLDYDIAVLGTPILQGNNDKVGRIAAYGEAKVTLEAGSSLASLVQLAKQIRNLNPQSKINYQARVDIHMGGMAPSIRIDKNDHFLLGTF